MQMDRVQGSLYGLEHSVAWIMALAAIVLGVIGLLTGLGVIDLRDTAGGTNLLPGIDAGAGGTTAGIFSNNFWDGTMLLFSAIAAAVLAYSLRAGDYHRMRTFSALPETEQRFLAAEHTGAYFFALGAIMLVAIGLLTGFGIFGDQAQGEGLIWIWAGLGSALLAMTLHAAGHHQTVADEDLIIAIVEERVTAGRPIGEPGRQAM